MKKVLYFIAATLFCSSCGNSVEYDACGNFEADEVLVAGQGTGQLLTFYLQEGMQVTRGVELGLIDTLQLHLQKRQMEAQMNSLKSSRPDIEIQIAALCRQLENLNSEKSRVEKLIAKGAAPSKQLDDINAQIETIQAQLSSQTQTLSQNNKAIDFNASGLAAQIAMIEDRIAKCKICSPVDGTVIAKYVNAGELVNIGTPLFKVADLDNMYIRAYFTSDQLGQVKLGEEVEVVADYGGKQQYSYSGRIVWISSESEFTPKAIQTRNTRANLVYAVKIAVKNDGRLKLGMYGEVYLNK